MILPGHLAIAIFAHKVTGADLRTLLAATLAPDMVDKSLAQVVHVAPSGRYAMHTALSWLISSLVVLLAAGRRHASAWALGYLGHLLGDGLQIPFWLPFRRYDFGQVMELDDFLYGVISSAEGRRNLLLEMLLLALALLMPMTAREESGLGRSETDSSAR